MSIMFPTIFAVAVKDLGPLTKTGSSFLVMSIIGGAVMTPLMGGSRTPAPIAWRSSCRRLLRRGRPVRPVTAGKVAIAKPAAGAH
jgi:hypothetical protein